MNLTAAMLATLPPNDWPPQRQRFVKKSIRELRVRGEYDMRVLDAGGDDGDSQLVAQILDGVPELALLHRAAGQHVLHVAGAGNEEPLAIKRETPETVCLGCHTEQHSDTFSYQPYLRDIVGAGHGAKLRESLGKGPTGHELRSAALARAKVAAATTPPPAP